MDNRELVRRYIEEVWSNGNLDYLNEALADDYVAHVVLPGIPPTRDGYRQWVSIVRDAVPDCRTVINDIMADGDKVITRWTASGTYSGSIMGIPATGQHGEVMGMTISRVQNGKVMEEWTTLDPSLAVEQLGAIAHAGHR